MSSLGHSGSKQKFLAMSCVGRVYIRSRNTQWCFFEIGKEKGVKRIINRSVVNPPPPFVSFFAPPPKACSMQNHYDRAGHKEDIGPSIRAHRMRINNGQVHVDKGGIS